MTDPAKPLGPAAQAWLAKAAALQAAPTWAHEHERAVTRAQAGLTSAEIIAEGKEIARLSSTHEGRRELAGRMSARLTRIAEAALKNVKYVGHGKYDVRPSPDNRTAMECLRYIAALEGLNAPVETKVEVTTDLTTLTDEQYQEKVRELAAKVMGAPK